MIFEPSYLKFYNTGELTERVKTLVRLLEKCTLCPRECGANRLKGELGYCQTGRYAKVASFSPHFGEESPLVGSHGSGTIFFSSCNLMCIFCQNYDISHFNHGVETGPKKLAAMMLALQAEGCHNINFVTPTHVMPQIMEALVIAAENGLHLPLVYNTSGYEKADIIQKLDKIIDIYMPDFKFSCSDAAELYCNAPDYFENARSAIKEMHNQVGDLIISNRGIAERGLLVRHLVMPGDVAGSRPIMAFLAQHISKDTYINIMDQYRPCYRARQQEKINAPITGEEYSRVLTWAKEAGLHRFDKRNYFRIRLI